MSSTTTTTVATTTATAPPTSYSSALSSSLNASSSSSSSSSSSPPPLPPSSVHSGSPTPISELKNGAADVTAADYYFQSYSHFGIHEEMLKDKVRTLAYRKAILGNPALFRDKVVLDVGCGTGILSMFAAKAGAKQVIGIECASIAVQAMQIVKDNKLDHIITIIQGKVEDVTLPVPHVDVIISEWMGYFLLYESMLDTVLYARDRWLSPTGILLPDRAALYVTLIEDAEYRTNKLEYWTSVYGFRMSAIHRMAMAEPLVDTATPTQVLSTQAARVLDVDVRVVTREQLHFDSAFSLVLARDDYVHALCAYFTVDFTAGKEKVHLTTAPTAPYTHWKSTILYLERPLTACKGEKVEGQIRVARNANNPRDLDIHLHVRFAGKHDQCDTQQLYRLR